MTQLLQSIVSKVHPSSVGALVGFGTIAVLVGIHELPIQWMTTAIALLVPGFTVTPSSTA